MLKIIGIAIIRESTCGRFLKSKKKTFLFQNLHIIHFLFITFAVFNINERCKIMNIDMDKEEFIHDATYNLKQIMGSSDIVISPSMEEWYDSNIHINDLEFIVVVRNTVSPSNFIFILDKLNEIKKKTIKPILLITRYIYPKLAEKFFQEGINVLDISGNAKIKSDHIFIYVMGNKAKEIKDKKKGNQKAFNETGLRLVFFLLMDNVNVNKSYRIISEETQLSLGSIKNIFDELKSLNFIITSRKGRFLKNRQQLISLWQLNYNLNLKSKLLVKRYTFINKEDRENWMNINLPKGMYWGGESGAYLVDGYLYPQLFDIYTEKNSLELMKTGKFKNSEKGEIRVYKKFWKGEEQTNTVSKLLIYADLMGSGDSRCLEAAKRLLANENITD